MIWTSKEIKKLGLTNLNGHFAQSYLIVLLFCLIMDIPALFFRSTDTDVSRLSLPAALFVLVCILAGGAFFLAPISVGKNAYFLELTRGKADFSALWRFFTGGLKLYVTLVKSMFLRTCTVVIGCMLFLIPGIRQYYHTFFVPWILAENPQTPAIEAMRKSRQMTTGQKMNLFIMQLTFLGWLLLCFFLAYRFSLILPSSAGPLVSTCMYALPAAYYHAAVAELYNKLKDR